MLCVVIYVTINSNFFLIYLSDGDDTFQAYHQDIGRISASPSQSPVASQTIVRQTQPAPTQATVITAPLSAPQFTERTQSNSRSRQQGQRKPNRITLAVRTSAPSLVTPVESSAPASIDAFRSSHLSAPPQQQIAPTFNVEPNFRSQYSQPQPQPQQQQQLPQAQFQASNYLQPAEVSTDQSNGPALSSFRSSANSVSARHSALMAQVAAERQVAASLSSQTTGGGGTTLLDFPSPTQASDQQPSLGSPLEALSSPAIAQVQPPPTLLSSAATAAASQPLNFVNQPEEPMVAPSFEHILSKGCPDKGVFSYENKDYCDRYYMCTNGTFTEEACPNGLAYGQMGAVYQHCAYNWNVDCGRKKTSEPLSSPGCPWQFGIFPVTSGARCSIDYFVCEWGVPETKRCTPEGLFYDDRIKGCQWADQLGCKSEALLNFKCPPEDEDNPYWPYPRYYHTKQNIIVCVNEQPRLVHCNEDQLVDPSSLACLDIKKKKKKF